VTEEESVAAGARAYTVSLPQGGFEGPLDLLLHLCQKHELDILDIPISFVTEKYLEYLAVMQLMDLDVAAEYLVMAATLAHIKSKMLLPAPPPGQEDEAFVEEEDPREALIRRLLEYQKYKRAGEELQARGVAGRDVFTRGAAIEEAVHSGLPPLADVPLFRLVEAFQSVLSKSKVKLAHDVVADRISITDRIHELADVLRTKRRLVFEELFDGMTTRFDLVITFLALLEMTRLRMTRLYQTEPLSPLYVELAADDTIAPPPYDDARPDVQATDDVAGGAPVGAPGAVTAEALAREGAAADDVAANVGDDVAAAQPDLVAEPSEDASAAQPDRVGEAAEDVQPDLVGETGPATEPPTDLAHDTIAPPAFGAAFAASSDGEYGAEDAATSEADFASGAASLDDDDRVTDPPAAEASPEPAGDDDARAAIADDDASPSDGRDAAAHDEALDDDASPSDGRDAAAHDEALDAAGAPDEEEPSAGAALADEAAAPRDTTAPPAPDGDNHPEKNPGDPGTMGA